jgi:hypothetical protein
MPNRPPPREELQERSRAAIRIADHGRAIKRQSVLQRLSLDHAGKCRWLDDAVIEPQRRRPLQFAAADELLAFRGLSDGCSPISIHTEPLLLQPGRSVRRLPLRVERICVPFVCGAANLVTTTFPATTLLWDVGLGG